MSRISKVSDGNDTYTRYVTIHSKETIDTIPTPDIYVTTNRTTWCGVLKPSPPWLMAVVVAEISNGMQSVYRSGIQSRPCCSCPAPIACVTRHARRCVCAIVGVVVCVCVCSLEWVPHV